MDPIPGSIGQINSGKGGRLHPLMWAIFWLWIPFSGKAQGHFQIAPRADIPILAGTLGLGGLGWYAHQKDQLIDPTFVFGQDPRAVPGLDRVATRLWSPGAATASDILAGLTAATPVLPAFLGSSWKEEWWKIGWMGMEAYSFQLGMMGLAKYGTGRARPYCYNPGIEITESLEKDALHSFYSSHTAFSAMGTFFAARIFGLQNPDSRLKPWVWAGAATLPAVVGFLRVRAGRHFPSDVAAGYACGALIGYLVPTLHWRKTNSPIHISMGPIGRKGAGFSFLYSF